MTQVKEMVEHFERLTYVVNKSSSEMSNVPPPPTLRKDNDEDDDLLSYDDSENEIVVCDENESNAKSSNCQNEVKNSKCR